MQPLQNPALQPFSFQHRLSDQAARCLRSPTHASRTIIISFNRCRWYISFNRCRWYI